MVTYRAGRKLAALPKSYALSAMPGILPFQREWLGKAFAKDVDLGSLSAARGSREEHPGRLGSRVRGRASGVLTRARRGGPDCRADNEPRSRSFVGRAALPGRRTRSALARFGIGGRCAPSADGF